MLPSVFARPRRGLAAVPLLLGLGLLATGSYPSEPRAAAAADLPTRAEPRAFAQVVDGLTHLSIVPEGSQARYRIRVRSLITGVSESVCATQAVSGEIVLDPDGAIVAELSKVTVDQRSLKCTLPLRDSSVQNTLETQLYPTADFAIQEAPGLPTPLPTAGEASFPFVGNQTIHGVTLPATYAIAALFGEGEMSGLGTTPIRLSEFNIKPPRYGPLLSIEDDMIVEVSFRAATVY